MKNVKTWKPPKTQIGVNNPKYWTLPLSKDSYILTVNKCPHCGEGTIIIEYQNSEVPQVCNECGGKFRRSDRR